MNLNPSTYECETHHRDLTERVKNELSEGVIVTYAHSLFGRRTKPRDFEVIVTCPGREQDGSAHELTCKGKRS